MLLVIASKLNDSSENHGPPPLSWPKMTSKDTITSVSQEVVDCRRLLTQLAEERHQIPWPELVSLFSKVAASVLYKEVNGTPETTPNPWPQEFTEDISEQTMLILDSIGYRVTKGDVYYTDFIVKETTDELMICLEFVYLIYSFYNKFKVYTNSVQYIQAETNLVNVRYILVRLTVRRAFEKTPPLRDRNSLLWRKLTEVECSASLLSGASSSMCRECGKKSFIDSDNFAITDACIHLFCIQCACKMFNVPDIVKKVCPVCHKDVCAWTDNLHFTKFKNLKGFKSMTWMTLHNLRQGRLWSSKLKQT